MSTKITDVDFIQKVEQILDENQGLFEDLAKQEQVDRLLLKLKDMAEVLEFYAMVNGPFYDRARMCLKRNFPDALDPADKS